MTSHCCCVWSKYLKNSSFFFGILSKSTNACVRLVSSRINRSLRYPKSRISFPPLWFVNRDSAFGKKQMLEGRMFPKKTLRTKIPWNFVGRIFWGLSRPWPLQGKMTSPAFRRSQRWNRRKFLTPRRSCWCSQMPVAMTSAISEMSFQTVEDAWQLFEFCWIFLVPSIPGTNIYIYTVYICTVYMVYMCVYNMYVYVYLYASKVKTTIPCHIMHFWTKDEQLLDCSLVFWHSRGPLKVGCQGPPMAFEFNFWGSRYARRSRFKLPHRLHGVLGFPVKPVATLKVELFHPAFLQGLPNEKGGKFWWDFLEIWCCRSEWNASWLARHLAGHIQREA